MAKDKDLDLELRAEELAQQLIQVKQRTKEVTEQFENATKIADDLVEKIREGSDQIDDISAGTLRWKVGLQKLTKQIGFINDQVVDHSKHLIQIKQQYSKLSNTAKKWLTSVNFGDIVEGYKTSLTQFRGMFFSSFAKMSQVALNLGKNFTELGQQGFGDATNAISSLDQALQQAAQDYSLMVTKVQWGQAIAQQQQLRDQLRTISEEMDNLDKTNEADLATYIEKFGVTRELQKQLSRVNNIVQNGRLVTDQVKEDAKQQLNILQDQRQVMYDMNKLQLALNEKLNPFMDKIDQSAEKLNSAKQGISDLFNVIGIDLIGIGDLLGKIDFNQLAKPLKTMVSTTTMQFALGFKAIKEKGIHSFKDVAKAGHGIFRGFVGGLGKMFFGLFSMLALGFIAAVGAMITAAIRRSQQLAQAFNSAQQSAGAISGQMANFGAIYGAFGGFLGGQKAAELYNTMLKLRDVTVATAKQAQLLQRHYAVSVTESSGMLQNMRYIMGLTEGTSNNLATATAQLAVQMGIQPQKMFAQLSNLSADVVKHFGGSTKQLYKTLIFANRLNLTMQDMASTAQGLMDIQSSIANAMEIQALTGKEIDIGQILRLSYDGKENQAVALYIKQLGSSFNTNNKVLLQSMSKGLNMPVDKIKSVAHEIQKNGGDIMQILEQSSMASMSTVEDAAKGNLKSITTSAYALQTSFQAIGTSIQNIILKPYQSVINYILENSGGILTFFKKFVKFTADITMMFIKWLERPSVQKGIADFFKSAYEFGVKLLDKVVIPIVNFLVKVYEKGGFLGLLGIFAFVKVLMSLPAIISAISGAVGLFSAKAATVPVAMAQSATPQQFTSWVDASGYSKDKYQEIKQNKGKQAAQAYKNQKQSVGQTKIREQADGAGAGDIAKKAKSSLEGSQQLTEGLPQAPPSKFESIAKSVLMLATAVAVLAGAVLIISLIPSDKVWKSVLAVGALLAMLVIAGNLAKGGTAEGVINLATAVDLLSASMLLLSGLNWGQIAKGLVTIAGLMLILVLASKFAGSGGSIGIVLLAGATFILAYAIKQLADVPFGKAMQALGVMTIMVVAITALAFGLQYIAPLIIVGIGILALMGLALISFGKGMQQAAKAAKMGLKPADLKNIGEVMVTFAKIVGKAMKALVTELQGVSVKQAKVAMKMITVFNQLIGSLKALYEIAKQPGAIDNIIDAVTKLAQSNVGQKVGTIMRQISKQLQGTKKKTAESINAMMGAFGEFVGGLGKLADLYKDPANKPDFASIVQGLTTPGPNGQPSVIQVMMSVMQQLLSIVNTKGQQVKTKTTEALKGMMQSFSSFIDILVKLKDLDLTAIGISIGLFTPQVKMLGESMKQLSDKLKNGKNYDSKLIDKFGTSLKTLASAMNTLNKAYMTQIFKTSLDAVLVVFKTNTTHVNNFANALTNLYNAFNRLRNLDTRNLKQAIQGALKIQAVKSMGLASQATAYSKVSQGMLGNLNKIIKGRYAKGGVVRQPQIALIGEDGPQAIIPLSESQYANNSELKGNSSFAGMQALLESIQGAANKPIQVILNVDGRKIAEAVANNTTPSYNLS